MSNARPSARQLQQFAQALRDADQAACRIRPDGELAALRDAYLASLR